MSQKNKDQTELGIEELINLLLNRAEALENLALSRFHDSYIKHPDFSRQPLPFPNEYLDRVIKAPRKLDKIVFLLGAGTSESAGIFLAKDIIKHCQKAIGKDELSKEVEKIRKKSLKKDEVEAVEAMGKIHDKDKELTFEEALTAYSKIYGVDDVLQLMREYFGVRESDFPHKTMITLFNECLAHLARERLVDFIITLNFDELLELSLDEDIGPNSYVKILSASRFQWAKAHGLVTSSSEDYNHPDQRNSEQGCESAKVWLLKPHGTISHENTLRLLFDQVWVFEREKKDVLKQVLNNAFLVVVGYSLAAADLDRILITHALSGSIKKLFYVDPGEVSGNKRRIKLYEVMESIRPNSFYHIKLDADEFVTRLFQKIYSEHSDEVKKRGLLPPFRHFLRAYVFRKGGVNSIFENRFLTELVIYCIRMKGWFSSRAISKSHQIKYMLETATSIQLATLNNIPKKLDPFLYSICRKGRAERLFFLRKKFESGELGKLTKNINQCIPQSMRSGSKMAKVKVDRKWENKIKLASKMGSQLQTLKDVAPYIYDEDIGTFRNILKIPNRSVLEVLTKWLLAKTEGLYIVGEVGQTVLNEDKKKIKEIAVGEYDKDWKSIKKELEKRGVLNKLYIKDIKAGASCSQKIKRIFGNKSNLIFPPRKRYHFTLWEDELNKSVQGIVFSRVDRQAGTTFYWVRLDLRDTTDKEQFEALKMYLMSRGMSE